MTLVVLGYWFIHHNGLGFRAVVDSAAFEALGPADGASGLEMRRPRLNLICDRESEPPSSARIQFITCADASPCGMRAILRRPVDCRAAPADVFAYSLGVSLQPFEPLIRTGRPESRCGRLPVRGKREPEPSPAASQGNVVFGDRTRRRLSATIGDPVDLPGPEILVKALSALRGRTSTGQRARSHAEILTRPRLAELDGLHRSWQLLEPGCRRRDCRYQFLGPAPADTRKEPDPQPFAIRVRQEHPQGFRGSADRRRDEHTKSVIMRHARQSPGRL